MKSFSSQGIATKGFFGYGRNFGGANPDPNANPPGPPPPTFTRIDGGNFGGDFIGAVRAGQIGDVVITTEGSATGFTHDSGVIWTRLAAPVATIVSYLAGGLATDGVDTYVAIGATALGAQRILTSKDVGITWTDVTPVAFGGGIAHWPGIFWSVLLAKFVTFDGTAANSYQSADGVTWTAHATPEIFQPGGQGNNQRNFFGENAHTLVVPIARTPLGSLASRIYSTTDGITWTLRFTFPNIQAPQGIVSIGEGFFTIQPDTTGSGMQMFTSPDGGATPWESHGNNFDPTLAPYPSGYIGGFQDLCMCGYGTNGSDCQSTISGETYSDSNTGQTGFLGLGFFAPPSGDFLFQFGVGVLQSADGDTWAVSVAAADAAVVEDMASNNTFSYAVGAAADTTGAIWQGPV